MTEEYFGMRKMTEWDHKHCEEPNDSYLNKIQHVKWLRSTKGISLYEAKGITERIMLTREIKQAEDLDDIKAILENIVRTKL